MRNFKDQKPKGRQTVVCDQGEAPFIVDVFTEVTRAETKHPQFVANMADALLVIGEELGEAQQAYIDFMYAGADKALIKKELIETAATIFRALLNFDELTTQPTQISYTDFNGLVHERSREMYGDYSKACSCPVCIAARESSLKQLLNAYQIVA